MPWMRMYEPPLLSGELESFLNTFPLMENRNSEHNDIQMANTGIKCVKKIPNIANIAKFHLLKFDCTFFR